MKPLVNLIGREFGSRIVVARAFPANTKSGAALWIVRCSCGREDSVTGRMLLGGSGHSCKSCGNSRHGYAAKKNPHQQAQAYRSWMNMRSRVGKGRYRNVACCERWNSFELFLQDMGDAADGMTLDRIDPTKDYEPSNCQWIAQKSQSGTRASSVKTKQKLAQIRKLLAEGMPRADVARACGVEYQAVWYIAKNPNAWISHEVNHGPS